MWSDIIQHGVKLIECSFSQVRSLAHHVVIFLQKLRFLENCDFGPYLYAWICMDHMGPVAFKAMYNKRACVKVYPLIYVCQATEAVHIEVCPNYSSEAFLLQWCYLKLCRGVPENVVSD